MSTNIRPLVALSFTLTFLASAGCDELTPAEMIEDADLSDDAEPSDDVELGEDADLSAEAADAAQAGDGSEAVDPAALKLHLKFDEESGTALSNSGDPMFSAQFRSGASYEWVAAGNPNCIRGGCLRFLIGAVNTNGISTNLRLNGAVHPSNTEYNYGRTIDASMSFSAWVNVESGQTAGKHQILSGDNGGNDWSLLYRDCTATTCRLSLFTGGTEYITAIDLVLGQRYHVAATYNTANHQATVYWNGSAVGTASPSWTDVRTTLPIYIGENPHNNWDERFKGYIDDVRVYGSALAGSNDVKAVACDDGDPSTIDTFEVTNGVASCTNTIPACLTDADCGTSFNPCQAFMCSAQHTCVPVPANEGMCCSFNQGGPGACHSGTCGDILKGDAC